MWFWSTYIEGNNFLTLLWYPTVLTKHASQVSNFYWYRFALSDMSVKFQCYQHSYRKGKFAFVLANARGITGFLYLMLYRSVSWNASLNTRILGILYYRFYAFRTLCCPFKRGQSSIFIWTQLSLAICFLMSTIYKVRNAFSNRHYYLFVLRINLI